MSIFGLLFIGLIAGWLAGLIMNSGGIGLVINLLVGVIGALLGGYLFHALGIQISGFFGGFVTATISAMLALFAIGLAKYSL
ncbi:MAG: GlsB/YeaQ/YmgE family stress response membrane protein [Pseudomonadota bacterium]